MVQYPSFWNLESFGSDIALIDESGRTIRYAELAALADAAVAPLGDTRQLVLIECVNDARVVAAYLGALRHGHPVILAGPGGGDPDADIVRTFRPNWIVRADGDDDFAFAQASTDPVALHPDLAVLLSTSGSTGSAKLVRLSRTNIAANAASIAEYLEMGPQDRSPTCLPMQYSYGMSVINSALASGGALFLTNRSISEPGFWSLFDRHRLTNIQGVPHSYELLAHSGFLATHHPSLAFLTQAGGRLPPAQVMQFARHAAETGARFYVMYGQTEAAPRIAWMPPEDVANHAGLIGKAVPGGELWIEQDGVRLPDGEEGELVYAGPNVMMGYALARADLALGKVTERLHTGDRARRHASGYFEITGRASRFIKPFGLRISLDEVENRLRQLGHVCAATGDDDRLVIAVERGSDEAIAALSPYMQQAFGLPAHVIHVVPVETLPRSANGKIDYPAIRTLVPKPEVSNGTGILDEAAALLDLPVIDPSRSFLELGGDSLSYVRFIMILERHLGTPPDGWEDMPLAKLDTLARATTAPAADEVRRTPAEILLRAIAVLLVVGAHCWPAFDWSLKQYGTITVIFDNATVLFMFMSGMLFQHMSAGFDYRRHLKQRLSVIVLPYLVMSIPALLGIFFVMQRADVWPWVYQLPIWQQVGFFLLTGKHLAPYWFIPMMTLFILAAPLFVLIDRRNWYWLLLPTVLLSTWYGRDGIPGMAGILGKAVFMVPAYLAGMGFARHRRGLEALVARYALLLVALLVLVSAGLWSWAFEPLDLSLVQKLLLATLLLVALKRVRLPARVDLAMGRIAEFSFAIYFIHGYVITTMRLLASRLGMQLFPPNGFVLAAMIVFAVAMSCGIIRLGQITLGKRSRYLIGA